MQKDSIFCMKKDLGKVCLDMQQLQELITTIIGDENAL